MKAYTPNSIEKDDFIFFPAGPKAPHLPQHQPRTLYKCVCCKKNYVDAIAGFDTCDHCLTQQ